MRNKILSNITKKLDPILFTSILLTSLLSLLVLYGTKKNIVLVEKQFIRIMLAFTVLIVVAQIPPHQLKRWSPVIYCLAITLLIIVILGGDVSKGARRWLDLKVVRFQPSEFIKIAMPILVAKYLHDKFLPPKLVHLIVPIILIALPCLLIGLQPDLGTCILIALSGVGIIFLAGIRWRTIMITCLMGVLATPIIWNFYLHSYQKQRIMTLINPNVDPLKTGYHINQSKIAIGSGGIFGQGWLEGSQTKLSYLPEPTTDFVFAVIAEKFGLFGCLILFSLYIVIIARTLQISTQTNDSFGRLVTGSFAIMFFVYFFVNVGMVCGILPVVGIPLPLVSYGGSSLITIMIGFGIIMSINHNRNLRI